MKEGQFEALAKGAKDLGVMGICHHMDDEQENFKHMIAVEGTELPELPGAVVLDIPASTFAVFEAVGPLPDQLQKVWKNIFSEWFPAIGYEHADAPELEIYYPGDTTAPDYKTEVWIPILEKKA